MSLYTVTFESESENESQSDDIINITTMAQKNKKKRIVRKRITKENRNNTENSEKDSKIILSKTPTPPVRPNPNRPQLRRSKSKLSPSQSEDFSNENEQTEGQKRKRRTPSDKIARKSSYDHEEENKEVIEEDIKIETPQKQPKLSEPIQENKQQAMPREIASTHHIIIQTYTIERTKTSSIRGSRTHFQIFHGGIPLFHSKIKSHGADEVITIASGTESHFSSKKFEGYLRSDGIFTNFSLRTGNEFGDEKLVIRYFAGKREGEPRNATCSIIISKEKKYHLVSRLPFIDTTGKWSINLPMKNALESIKNMVLETDDKIVIITIGKISKTTLQIDADESIPPLTVFALGISAFLCKL